MSTDPRRRAAGEADRDDHCPCPLRDVQAAVEAMLDHRGAPWHALPRGPESAGGGADEAAMAEAFGYLGPAAGGCARPHACAFLVPERRLILVITDQARIGMVQLRQAHAALRAHGLQQLQLVSRHALTTQTMHLNQALPERELQRVSVLLWSVVLFHPLDHDLVPAHRRATPEERRRCGPLSSLPLLRADDAVAQYLALRPGDVVRIDRRDGTVYFRLVA